MAEITAQMVKELRDATNAGVLDCRKALAETEGNFDAAVEVLRKKGLSTAAKKSGRETNQGMIGHYIHGGGKVASLIEVNCETDFVARTERFQQLAHDLAMHVVAARPLYVSRTDVPDEVVERDAIAYRERGDLDKWYAEVCLLEQPYIKNPAVTIQDLLVETVAAVGENIRVGRFSRLAIGE